MVSVLKEHGHFTHHQSLTSKLLEEVKLEELNLTTSEAELVKLLRLKN